MLSSVFGKTTSLLFIRLGLAASFLSAVADRLGYWGPSGSPGVAWGNFDNFLKYTASLNPWAPVAVADSLGYAATLLEVVFGVLLIIGIKVRLTALASFGLLSAFALSMTFTSGVKGPLDYSVFTAAAAALLLYNAYPYLNKN